MSPDRLASIYTDLYWIIGHECFAYVAACYYAKAHARSR